MQDKLLLIEDSILEDMLKITICSVSGGFFVNKFASQSVLLQLQNHLSSFENCFHPRPNRRSFAG
jgi:hypothetical protein